MKTPEPPPAITRSPKSKDTAEEWRKSIQSAPTWSRPIIGLVALMLFIPLLPLIALFVLGTCAYEWLFFED